MMHRYPNPWKTPPDLNSNASTIAEWVRQAMEVSEAEKGKLKMSLKPNAKFVVMWESATDRPDYAEFPSSEAALEKIRELQAKKVEVIKYLEIMEVWTREWKKEEIKAEE